MQDAYTVMTNERALSAKKDGFWNVEIVALTSKKSGKRLQDDEELEKVGVLI